MMPPLSPARSPTYVAVSLPEVSRVQTHFHPMRIQDRINKTQGMIDVGWCVVNSPCCADSAQVDVSASRTALVQARLDLATSTL